MPGYSECYSTFSETRRDVKEFVHTWKINDFKTFYPGTDKCIGSKAKVNGQDLWHLNLYKESFHADTADYIGISVSFKKELVHVERTPYLLSIHIVKKNEEEYEVYKSVTKQESVQVTQLVERNYLLNEKNELLPNGNLILRFKIYFDFVVDMIPTSAKCSSLKNNPKLNGLENIFNKTKFSDVKIVVGDKVFWAYKGILANQSPVFEAMFEHDMKETKENVVEITDMDQKTVEEMLRFMYIGKVKHIEDAAHLFAAADKYEIEGLRLMCEEILIEALNLDTVISYLIFAEKYGATILREKALDFFKLQVKTIIKSQEYKEKFNEILLIISEIIEDILL